jgi:hypothetical protein
VSVAVAEGSAGGGACGEDEVGSVDAAGVVDLGDAGVCVLAEVEATSWALSGPADRDAAVTAWAGLLDALTGSVVDGREKIPVGGQEISPSTDSGSPHGRDRVTSPRVRP